MVVRAGRNGLLLLLLLCLLTGAEGEPPDPGAELLAEANRRFEGGDFAGAARAFEEYLATHEAEEGVILRLARAHHELGDSAAFEEAVRRLLALDPRSAEAHLLRGRRFQKEGRFPEAEKAYQRSLEISPRSVEALSGLAEVSLALGYDEEGIAYLRRILEISPRNIPFLWMLARAVEDPEEERRLYERIVAASPAGNDLAEGRLNLLASQAPEGGYLQVHGLERPQRVRLFFNPGKPSRAQFVDEDAILGPDRGGVRRRATPNTPYVRAKVNGQGPYRFLLDTGTQGIHISRKLMRKLSLRSYGTSRFEGLGVGDTLYGEIVFLESLQLDGVELRRVPSESIDLEGIGDGILNPAAFRGLRVQIHNSHRAMTLSRWPEPGEPDPLRPRADSRRGAPVTMPFLLFNGHVVIRVEIQGMTMNALLDTGAESTILDRTVPERLPSLETFKIAGYGVTLEGITGEVVDARVVREVQITLSSENLHVSNLFSADLRRLANFYGPDIHVILGMRELARFDITLDYRGHEITFQRILR